MPRLRALLALASTIAVVATVSACGSSSDNSSTASASTSGASSTTSGASSTTASAPADSGVAEAKKAADAAFTPPDQIPVTTKLKTKPPKQTVAFIEPQIPAGKSQTQGFKNAAEAIGWNLKVIPSDPFKPAGAVQQAIDQKVDYIFMTGAPMALISEQLANADKAGIPVLSCYGTDAPGGKDGTENKGLYAQCGDQTSAMDDGKLLADWAVGDSDGKANILSVNIPDYPILVAQEKGFTDEVSATCPDCKVSKLGVTVDDLAGGKVPQAIASKLQADPSIDYVFFTMADLPAGVYDTLSGAGLADKVKLFGLDFNEANLKAIEGGQQSVAMGLPKEYSAWLMFQFAAELEENGHITDERKLANLPRILVGKDQAAQYLDTRAQWPGPVGFQDQFKALWNVG
jgi:ribose transport system substrate-binding protein